MIRETIKAANEELGKEIDQLAEKLLSGSCSSYEHYKHLCGRIQGLRQAQEINQQALQRTMNHDDDDD